MKKVFFTLMLLLTAVFSYAADEFAGLNKVNVWTGTHVVNWSTSLDLNAAKFATAQVGDKVAFTVKAVGANAEIFVQNSEWVDVPDMTIKPIASSASCVSFEITDAAWEALQGALHIKGQNVTITSIDLYQQAEIKQYESTVVYAGPSIPFNSWKGEVSVTADKFMDAQAGDKIRINFIDIVKGAQIQINDGSFQEQFVPYDDILDSYYDFVLTDENVDIIQVSGIALKGQKATVATIELLIAKNSGESLTVNEVAVKCDAPKTFSGSANWNTWITIPGSSFADAQVGDKVKFYIETVGSNPQLQIANKAWNSIFASKPQVNVSGDSYMFKIEDEDMLASLKEGAYIKGANVTVAKISLLTTAPLKNYLSAVIYDGPAVALGAWTNHLEVSAAGFASVKAGDKIVVHFTKLSTGAQVQLNTMAPEWNSFVKYDDIVGDSYEYVLTDASIVAELKQYGLAIKGQKASVASVELLSLQETTGISELVSDKKFNDNQKVEIFDLTGKRLSNMNGRGIYLLRQGNKTVKVMK